MIQETIVLKPASREELREWLLENAATQKEVWVHCIRRAHPTILAYEQVVEEALCFGWIDSTVHSNPGGEGIIQRLSPRRKGSHWTELNVARCRKMIEMGRMTKAGMEAMPGALNKCTVNR